MIFAEIMFVNEKCWFEMLNEMLIKMLLKCWSKCWLTIWWNLSKAAFDANTSDALTKFRCQKCYILMIECTDGFSICVCYWAVKLQIIDNVKNAAFWWSNALTGFRYCQKIIFDAETIKCIDEFSMLSKNCILIIECIDKFDDDVKKIAFWRLNALTNWRFCQKIAFDAEKIKCIDEFSMMSKKLHFDNWMHGRIFDLFDANKSQTNKRNESQTDKQTTKREMKRCLLTVKTNKLIREKWWKQWFNRDVFKKRAESTATNNWSWNF